MIVSLFLNFDIAFKLKFLIILFVHKLKDNGHMNNQGFLFEKSRDF